MWAIDGAVCDTHPSRATRFTNDDTEVTCLRCLYHMGLYVPLERLKEHQFMLQFRTKHAAGAPYAGH
jgi:hypothetical protein